MKETKMPAKTTKTTATKAKASSTLLASKQSVNKKGLFGIVSAVAVVGIVVLVKVHGATFVPIAYVTHSYNSTTQVSTSAVSQIEGVTKAITPVAASSTTMTRYSPRYSPDKSKIAWLSQSNSSNASTLSIYTVSSKSTKTINLPSGILVSSGPQNASVVWYPSNQAVALVGSTTGGTNYLYTYSLSASSVSQVPNVSSSGINDLAVLGDGKHIVYAHGSQVSSVVPGSAPAVIVSNVLTCNGLHSRPNSTTDVSMYCSAATSPYAQTIYTVNGITSAKTAAYSATSTSTIGATYNFIQDITWSPDGSKFGVLFNSLTNTASCMVADTEKVGRVSAAGGGSLTTIAALPSQTHQDCAGGGGEPSQLIAWDSTNTYMAFVTYASTTAVKGTGYMYRISATASTVQTPTLMIGDGTVGGIDW